MIMHTAIIIISSNKTGNYTIYVVVEVVEVVELVEVAGCKSIVIIIN